jgi:hypothetical protein
MQEKIGIVSGLQEIYIVIFETKNKNLSLHSTFQGLGDFLNGLRLEVDYQFSTLKIFLKYPNFFAQ